MNTTASNSNRPNIYPMVNVTERNDESAELSFEVTDELAFFEGHFPDQPVVPGVVQLQWADHYAQPLFSVAGSFHHLEAIKFQHVMRPGDKVLLSLSYNADNQKLSFRFYQGDRQYSSGRIVYGRDANAGE